MPGQAPGTQPAAPATADQSQAAPGTAQPDYTKAWEEYYKKMGESTFVHIYTTRCMILTFECCDLNSRLALCQLQQEEELRQQQGALRQPGRQQRDRRITAPRGPNTTDSRPLITDRRDRPPDSQERRRRASRYRQERWLLHMLISKNQELI